MMDIDKAFEQFIEFQEGSSGNLVTTVSAKLFAKYCTETLQEENERLLAANRHSEDMYRQIDDERKRLQAEVELMRSYRDAERQWEMLMMRLVGEDGLGSVEQAVTELKQERDQLKAKLSREEGQHMNTVDQRDMTEQFADRLSSGIAEIEIGEHSSANNPWAEAITAIEEFDIAVHDAEVIERARAYVTSEVNSDSLAEDYDSALEDYANQLRQQAKEVQS
jgi:transcriptional regulator with XRE-family HTH domain